MNGKRFSNLFFGSIVLIAFIGFVAWRYAEKHNPNLSYYGGGKIAANLEEVSKKNISKVPDFKFVDQDSAAITSDFVKGKVWVANYFFTRCGIVCPKMSSQIARVQEVFDNNEQVKIVSFSCDPERDTPSLLKEYAAIYGANLNQWKFVTGDKKPIYSFARHGLNIVATEGDGGDEDFIHSQSLVLIDEQGFVRGYYDGMETREVDQLILDIKKLL